uniref:Putative odorant binding protein 86 n=1 Tax=Nasonia vitripennis TaxID=7425 RepID=G8B1U1_NASVI|nr:putative odorant binding protein 86 [Nasonia vitripennis]
MKSYSVILLAICFAAIYSSSALISIEDKAACLKKNGLNNTEKWDLTAQFDYRLEKPFTCYVACVINAIKKPEETVYGKLSEVIERGHVIPASLKKDMENRLDSCYRYNGEGDDCKLLYCVKILQSPLIKLSIYSLEDIELIQLSKYLQFIGYHNINA